MKVLFTSIVLLSLLPSVLGKVRGEKSATHSQHGRKAVKVGANKNPKVTPRNPSDSCEDAEIDGKPVFNNGELKKICLGGVAKLCTYYYGYTEYECECLSDDQICASIDPSDLTDDNACLPGYVLRRNNLQGALFWTCDVV